MNIPLNRLAPDSTRIKTGTMRRFLPLLLPIAGFSSVTLVGGTTEPRVISADMNAPLGLLNQMPTLCVGAGRANEGLRADWQRQLAKVNQECGFRFVRFHGLLCDDMGVYVYDGRAKQWVYNWQYIDELFDAILDTGMRPFIELGFMPSGMASGDSTIFWWKGNVTPPKDPEQWRDLISSLVAHWTERYGEEEVVQWHFEVWNEPNLSGFWIGDTKGMQGAEWEAYARAEYFKLYQVTAEAVKSVNPRYRVGGPATAGNAWVPETIAFCEDNGVPLDFITTHHYAVTAGYLDESGNAGTVLSPDRDAMTREVRGVRGQIEASSMPGLPLHYTEWSSSYTPSDPVHDSYHSAAFILNKLKGIGGAAQSMSYWTFTDIFEEAGPRATPFHGGFGLINYQGIPKPSFYAYQFFHQLGPVELANSDADAWVCKDDAGGVQVLAWDFTITHPGPSINNQDYYPQDLPAADAPPMAVRLANLKPGDYTLSARKVGYRANDAHTAYIDMGRPRQLSREQVATLKKKADGTPFLVEKVTVGEDGTFERTFPMRQNDVLLVTLEP